MKRSMLDSASLPIAELAVLAQRESHRPRPVYTAHKWFARRFGTAIRGLLVSYAAKEGDDFWAAFHGEADLTGVDVADLFIGGGTSLYEAQRLGANVVGVDIDPVACLVTEFELSAHMRPNPMDALPAVMEAAHDQRLLYRTVGPDGDDRDGLHFFWVQTVECGGCAEEFDAHPTYVIANAGDKQWILCSHCGEPALRAAGTARLFCECGRTTDVARGTIARGKVTCPHCAHQERLIEYARRTKNKPRFRMFAIESVPITTTAKSVPIAQRVFHKPSATDLAHFESAATRLEAEDTRIPNRLIPQLDRSDNRLTSYGYTMYRELFNARQLLHLAGLLEQIESLPLDQRPAFAMALSNHLTSNCMLTRYSQGYRQVTPLFALRAFAHSVRPVELNPWLRGSGRGTFPNAVRKVGSAIAFAKEPKELTKDGFTAVPTRASRSASRVINGDSRAVPEIATNSADLILTDPPYMDNIDYSELSDFYLPWLQATGQLVDPGGPSPRSLAAKGRIGDEVTTFREGLSQCFAEGARIMRSGGRMVFTFQHQSDKAWEALGTALNESGLAVSSVFPMQGDSEMSVHRRSNSTTWDAVFVLRHRRDDDRIHALELQGANHLQTCIRHASRWASELSLTDANRQNLSRATVAAGAAGFLAPLEVESVHALTLADALRALRANDVNPEVEACRA